MLRYKLVGNHSRTQPAADIMLPAIELCDDVGIYHFPSTTVTAPKPVAENNINGQNLIHMMSSSSTLSATMTSSSTLSATGTLPATSLTPGVPGKTILNYHQLTIANRHIQHSVISS